MSDAQRNDKLCRMATQLRGHIMATPGWREKPAWVTAASALRWFVEAREREIKRGAKMQPGGR